MRKAPVYIATPTRIRTASTSPIAMNIRRSGRLSATSSIRLRGPVSSMTRDYPGVTVATRVG